MTPQSGHDQGHVTNFRKLVQNLTASVSEELGSILEDFHRRTRSCKAVFSLAGAIDFFVLIVTVAALAVMLRD